MANLIEVQMDNGRIFLETNMVNDSEDLLEHVSGNRIIKKTKSFLTDTFEQLKEFSNEISESINGIDLKPDEMEVEFAVKFSADAGIIVSSVGTEASITVKMKWNTSKGD